MTVSLVVVATAPPERAGRLHLELPSGGARRLGAGPRWWWSSSRRTRPSVERRAGRGRRGLGRGPTAATRPGSTPASLPASGEVLLLANPDVGAPAGKPAAACSRRSGEGYDVVGPQLVWDDGGGILLPRAGGPAPMRPQSCGGRVRSRRQWLWRPGLAAELERCCARVVGGAAGRGRGLRGPLLALRAGRRWSGSGRSTRATSCTTRRPSGCWRARRSGARLALVAACPDRAPVGHMPPGSHRRPGGDRGARRGERFLERNYRRGPSRWCCGARAAGAGEHRDRRPCRWPGPREVPAVAGGPVAALPLPPPAAGGGLVGRRPCQGRSSESQRGAWYCGRGRRDGGRWRLLGCWSWGGRRERRAEYVDPRLRAGRRGRRSTAASTSVRSRALARRVGLEVPSSSPAAGRSCSPCAGASCSPTTPGCRCASRSTGRMWKAAQIVDVFSAPRGARPVSRRGVWVQTVDSFFAVFGALRPLRRCCSASRAGGRCGWACCSSATTRCRRSRSATCVRRGRRRPRGLRRRLTGPSWPATGSRASTSCGSGCATSTRWRWCATPPCAAPAARASPACATTASSSSRGSRRRRWAFVAFRTDGGRLPLGGPGVGPRPPGRPRPGGPPGGRPRGADRRRARGAVAQRRPGGARAPRALWASRRPPEPNGLVMVARSFAPELDVGALDGGSTSPWRDADLV